MEPNDLPIVCIPLELPAEAAAELLQFLRHLTETLLRASCTDSTKRARARGNLDPASSLRPARNVIRRSDSTQP